MNYELLKYIIIFILVLGILFFVLKSLVKVIIIGIIIAILFGIGWTYTSDDLKNKLFLDKIVNEKYIENIYDKYDNYVDKREKEDNLINPENIEDIIREEIDRKVNEYRNKLN